MVHNLFWQTVVFVEDNYSMDHRGGEWFQDGSSALHLSCILFLLLHQLHLKSSGLSFWRLGRVGVLSRLSCLTLCDPKGCSGPGSSVHVILRQEYWSGLPCPPPGDLPNPDPTRISCGSCSAGGFFTAEPLGSPWEVGNLWSKLISSL